MLRTYRARSPRSQWFRPRLALLEAREVPAAVSWDGGPTGLGTEWTDATNWAGDKLPTSSDDATIPAAFAGVAITYSSGISSIQKLTSEATIAINGGSLALTSGISTANKGLTVASLGTLELRGVTLNGTVNNQGLIRGQGSVSLTGQFNQAAGANLRLDANNQLTNAILTLSNGFTNNGTIELTCTSGAWASTLAVTTGTLTNAAGGKIAVQTGAAGGRNINAQLDNQGTMNIDQPLTIAQSSAKHVNTGTITANADLTISQSGTTPSFAQKAGSITIASGKTLTVSNGTFDLTGGTVMGPGSFKQSSGTFNYTSGLLDSLALLTINLATANLTPALSNPVTDLAISFSTINGPGILTNTKTLDINGSTINTQISNQGLLLAHGTNTVATLSTNAASIVRVESNNSVSNSALTVTNGFVNNGAIELNCTSGGWTSTLGVTNGTLTNASAGQIAIQTGAGGGRNLNAQLDNQGTLTIDQPLTLSRTSSSHSNTGTVTVNADLTISQSGTTPSFAQKSGAISIAVGKILSVSGGTFNLTGGTINGPGSLKITSGAFNQSSGGTLGNLSSLTLSSATCNITPDFTNATTDLFLSASTYNGPGLLTNVKSLDLNGSTINTQLANQGSLVVRGTSAVTTLSTGAGSLIHIESSNSVANSALTIANGFVNNGTIELTCVSGGWTSSMTVTTGTLTNASGGKIAIQSGAGGGGRNLNAQLDNQGTITIDQPLSISPTSADHVNSGTISVNADVTVTQAGTTPSFTQKSGTIAIANGKILSFTGGVFDLTGGTLDGPGAFKMTVGTFNHPGTGTLGNLSQLSLINNSTGNFTPNFSNATTDLVLNSATFNGPGTLTNFKTLNLDNSTVKTLLVNQATVIAHGTAAVTNLSTASGSTIRIEASNTFANSTLTVSNGFTNNGTIELTTTSGAWASALTVSTGTLTNSVAGVIVAQPGAGGTRTLNATLDNQGTITVDQALSISQTAPQHKNSGLIHAQGGNISISQTGAGSSFNNQGTIQVDAGRDITISGGSLTNFSGTTLIGGNYLIAGNFRFPGANIVTNAASITLDGAASAILDSANGKNGLTNLASNAASGSLSFLNGRGLTTTGAMTNAGSVFVDVGSTLVTGTGYTQTAGITKVNGTLDPAADFNLNGGTLGGNGLVQANVNNPGGIVSPGDSPGQLTIVGDYVQSGTGQLKLELNGPTAIVDYDRLNVQGKVTLGGNLDATVGYKSTSGENFVILTNDGTDATAGTMSGLADNSTVIINGFRFRVNYNAGDGNDVVLTRLATGIDSIVVDDGSAQRSQIRYFTVTFNAPVIMPPNAADGFVLQRVGPGSPVGSVNLSVDTSASTPIQTIAKLTVSGPLTQNNSLIDGRYTLSVLGAQLLDVGGQPIDADNDGTPGGTNISNLHRFFGDVDGDGTVAASDFIAFRQSFNGVNDMFDFDGDGAVSASDFVQFRNRFNTSI